MEREIVTRMLEGIRAKECGSSWRSMCNGISRRKQMEEAISGMSRKPLESQEQERARIGRELHDDINQRLAMLSVELEQVQNDPSDVQNRLQKLRKRTTEISNDVQAL